MATLLVAGCSDDRPPPVVFLGVDGATWDVIEPMAGRGELPNFARVMAEGVHSDLLAVGPQISPVIWTTMATGHFGRNHGILDFVFPYTPGPKTPVESTQRQVPAIWNIASQHGRSVGVVGYFSSFPAEPVNGVMVSDRAYLVDEPAARYPTGVLSDLDTRDYQHPDVRASLWGRFFSWAHGPDRPDDSPAVHEARRLVTGRVDQNILFSEFLREATLRLLDDSSFDLFITYFRIVDFASHSLWAHFEPEAFPDPPDPAVVELLSPVIPESYRYMDEVLGEILARIDLDRTNLVIVSDHGFGPALGHFTVREADAGRLSGNHRPDGIFLAAGPDFATGRIDEFTVLDVFPLLAVLQRLPLADDLPGSVPTAALRPDFFAEVGWRSVASYGPRDRAAGDVDVARTEQASEVESLRGLGYIGEGFELGDREVARWDFYAAQPDVLIDHLVGEIVFALYGGHQQLARDRFEEARTRRPDVARGLAHRVAIAFEILDSRVDDGVPHEEGFRRFLDWAEARPEGRS